MQDEQIVDLYWKRDEQAITETQLKYGSYLKKIAYNILADVRDSEESVNDTYMTTWNSIPPHRPEALLAFLAKITRHISIDLIRKKKAKKRKAYAYEVSLEELEECLAGGDTSQEAVDATILALTINAYLWTISEEARRIFVGRYFFLDSYREVADYLHINERKVKNSLYRTRQGLREYLKKEGYDV